MARTSAVEALGPDDDKETDGNIQDAPESSSAATAVHDTPELLEMILLHLPLPRILTIQRVSKTFQGTIDGSPTIQKTLFFRASTDYTLQLYGHGIEPAHCPDLSTCNTRDESDITKPRGVVRWTRGREDENRYDITVNPFIEATKHASLNVDLMVPTNHGAMQLGATWRDMLLTQPPVQRLIVDHWTSCHWHVIRAADLSRGVTLADVEKSMASFSGAQSLCKDVTVAHAEEWDVMSSERTDPRKVLEVPCWEIATQVVAAGEKQEQKKYIDDWMDVVILFDWTRSSIRYTMGM